MSEPEKDRGNVPGLIGIAGIVLMVVAFTQLILLSDLLRPGITVQRILFDVVVFLVLLPILRLVVIGAVAEWWYS